MQTYLAKRGSVYYFRRTIPLELRSFFKGKTEFTFSLRTKDRKQAATLCRQHAVQTDVELERAALKTSSAEKRDAPNARAAALEVLSVPEILRYASVIAKSYRHQLEEIAPLGGLAAKREHMQEMLHMHRYNLRDGSLANRFSLSTSEAIVMGLEAVLTGAGAAELAAIETAPETPEIGQDGVRMSGLIEPWAAQQKPTTKSIDGWKRTCALFTDLIGDRPVSTFAKADIRAFRDHLIALGNRPATVKSRLNHLKSLFETACQSDIIAVNPCKGVKPPPADRAITLRAHFAVPELQKFFAGPVHSGDLRPLGGAGEASYWLPLLALYTGARLNELGQLRPKDVVQESYRAKDDSEQSAWVIRIVEDAEANLSVKNAGSVRRVPIHADLIDLGFLSYVSAMADQKAARIFPLLVPDRYGTITGNWSKWFSRYLREKAEIASPLIVFHSFRHSFKHYARQCGIAKPINDVLTGHGTGEVADTYGGIDYPLRPLVDAMSIYKVSGFTLPKSPSL